MLKNSSKSLSREEGKFVLRERPFPSQTKPPYCHLQVVKLVNLLYQLQTGSVLGVLNEGWRR